MPPVVDNRDNAPDKTMAGERNHKDPQGNLNISSTLGKKMSITVVENMVVELVMEMKGMVNMVAIRIVMIMIA